MGSIILRDKLEELGNLSTSVQKSELKVEGGNSHQLKFLTWKFKEELVYYDI